LGVFAFGFLIFLTAIHIPHFFLNMDNIIYLI